MSNHWQSCLGEILDGKYALQDLIGERGGAAIFSTSYRDSAAIARIVKPSTPTLESWRTASKLAHPNLLTVYDSGLAKIDGDKVAYSITEPVDEYLGDVVRERPLTTEEAQVALTAVLSGLESLHRLGLVHGSVGPDAIVAANDQVKLTADTISRGLPDSDMRGVGETIVGMLSPGRGPAKLESPFREIALGCLDSNAAQQWTATKALAVLEGRETAPRAEARVSPAPAQVLQLAALPPSQKQSSQRWLLPVAVAAIGVIATSLYFVRDRTPAAQPAVAAEQRRAPEPPVTKAPEQVSERSRSALPPPARATPQPAAAAANVQAGWAVVAAIYNNFESAEKRAASMTNRSRAFQPEVYPAKGTGRRYFVVLRSGMSKEEAEDARREARSAGFPADSYVTKLTGR